MGILMGRNIYFFIFLENLGVHFISCFAFKCVYVCVEMHLSGRIKKHPETKQLLRQKKQNKTVHVGKKNKKNNSHLPLREGIILGCQAAKNIFNKCFHNSEGK